MTDRAPAIEIPFALKNNPRDRRGFPIPFIVYRDDAGVPHFTINDVARSRAVLHDKLCALCGKPHKFGAMWFIGGVGAAFHENGLYADPPAHEACGRFAVRVCPFIAAPNYSKRIETRTLDPQNVSDTAVLVDNNMDNSRPPFFVLSRSSGYRVIEIGPMQTYIQPRRPWKDVEYWLKGEQIEQTRAAQLLLTTDYHPDMLMWWPTHRSNT